MSVRLAGGKKWNLYSTVLRCSWISNCTKLSPPQLKRTGGEGQVGKRSPGRSQGGREEGRERKEDKPPTSFSSCPPSVSRWRPSSWLNPTGNQMANGQKGGLQRAGSLYSGRQLRNGSRGQMRAQATSERAGGEGFSEAVT